MQQRPGQLEDSDSATMRSGELARRAGVNTETLRYYERRGLLPDPDRRPSGYREYPPEALGGCVRSSARSASGSR